MFDLAVTMDRDGGRCKMGNLDARIICTDRAAKNGPPLLVLIMSEIGHEDIYPYTEQGNYLGGDPLTTLPETKVFYSYVYSDGTIGNRHCSLDECLKVAVDVDGKLLGGGAIKITMTGDLLTSVEQVAL